jgi:hypothetical protein
MRKTYISGNDAPAIQDEPRQLRYHCFANNCPMPGTIFPGGSDSGVCAWHYGCNGSEVAKVSQVLADWDCVVRVVNAGRRCLTGADTATDGRAQSGELAALWRDLAPAVWDSGWKLRVEPQAGENLGDWTRRMERFLRNRCKEALTGRVIANDNAPTPTVADMRSRVRGALPASTGDW